MAANKQLMQAVGRCCAGPGERIVPNWIQLAVCRSGDLSTQSARERERERPSSPGNQEAVEAACESVCYAMEIQIDNQHHHCIHVFFVCCTLPEENLTPVKHK